MNTPRVAKHVPQHNSEVSGGRGCWETVAGQRKGLEESNEHDPKLTRSKRQCTIVLSSIFLVPMLKVVKNFASWHFTSTSVPRR